MTEVLALIPARAGSKSVPDKNVAPLGGRPMLVHSIEQALASSVITRAIVSTDSERYAEIAKEAGAEVPFLRPAEFAQDLSTDLEVFQHALRWLADNEDYTPDIVVHLRPTHPIRLRGDLDAMVAILLGDDGLDSVRSVAPEPLSPLKVWYRDEDGTLRPVAPSDLSEPYNLPRQALPQAYRQNGSIDVARASVILGGSMTGERIYGYVMSHDFDIDTPEDLERAVAVLELLDPSSGALEGVPRTWCFDVDGVIASLTPGNDYSKATPIEPGVRLVQALAKRGHRIVLYTARGSATGIDWSAKTAEQMAAWGVHYDELVFGKPAADHYVDDRMITLAQIETALEADAGPGGEPHP